MIGKAEEIIAWLFSQDRDKEFEIKEHKEKRSLNANAYAWSMIGKIADAMRMKKDEVYLEMLRNYGQSEVVSVRAEINVDGFFKYWEEIGRSSLNGKEFVHYRIFKGSSEYNTQEMAILIDGIVQEAENLGIETLPPEQIKSLEESWRG